MYGTFIDMMFLQTKKLLNNKLNINENEEINNLLLEDVMYIFAQGVYFIEIPSSRTIGRTIMLSKDKDILKYKIKLIKYALFASKYEKYTTSYKNLQKFLSFNLSELNINSLQNNYEESQQRKLVFSEGDFVCISKPGKQKITFKIRKWFLSKYRKWTKLWDFTTLSMARIRDPDENYPSLQLVYINNNILSPECYYPPGYYTDNYWPDDYPVWNNRIKYDELQIEEGLCCARYYLNNKIHYCKEPVMNWNYCNRHGGSEDYRLRKHINISL